MNTLLTVLAFSAGDAPQAERLCDWLFQLNGNRPIGDILLIADSEVHPEMQTKVKIAAEVAFETVELAVAPPCERIQKAERINNLFKFAAFHASQNYRLPWLWIEPDCVPVKPTWLVDLSLAYHAQPKRFMGPHLKARTKEDKEVMFIGRTAVYPVAAVRDIEPYCNGNMPFNILAAHLLIERSTKTRLIQQIAYDHETTFDKIRPDAVMVHSDKTGALLNHLRAAHQPKPETPENGHAEVVEPKRRGRPPTKHLMTI